MVTTITSPALCAAGLHKAYGKGAAVVQAVGGVDIDLHENEIVAIMEASGSGKTTLLRLLAGLIRPDSGDIRFGERNLSALSYAELTTLRCQEISVIFQAYNLLPTLTAIDNVALPLLLNGAGGAEARARANEALGLVGSAGSTARRPPQLSGGEQQRVAIARALVNDPRVLLADEPTGNLDLKNTAAVCRLLRQVGASAGRAVAVVTHDPFVAYHADRVAVLVDGRVADSFSCADVSSAEGLALRYLALASASAAAVG